MRFNRTLIAGTRSTLILHALRHHARGADDIVQTINQLSSGRLEWRPGTIYALLDQLESAGLVQVRQVISEFRKTRKLYSLTASGREALTARIREWFSFSDTISALLTAQDPQYGRAQSAAIMTPPG